MDGRFFVCGLLLWNIAAVFATPEYHRVRSYKGSMYADEDVMIDPQDNYALITVTKIHGLGTPTINLHDFAVGYSAYKDVENGRCYIYHSLHTLAEMTNIMHEVELAGGRSNFTKFVNCQIGDLIPPSKMYQTGTRVARFCQDYDSYLIDALPATIPKRSAFSAAFGCFICLFNC